MSKFDNLYGGQLRTMKEALLKERNLLSMIADAIDRDDTSKLNKAIEEITGDIGEIVTKQRNKDHR